MEFRILGPLEVVDDDRVVPLGGLRQRTLLALLLLRANQIVSVDALVDGMWRDRPPQATQNALQYHVSQLRKLLGGDRIATRGPGYVIRVEPDELDLTRFERLADEAARAEPARAAELLGDGLALWRGPPLADLSDSFAQADLLRLDELRVAALERRVEADLARGCGDELIAELETLAREHPRRERFRAALMQSLYRAGRQADALDVYRETRQTLVDELGIEPSPVLQDLERAILRQDPALAPARARPERSILVVASDATRLDGLLAVAEPLARKPARELILARLLRDHGGIGAANAELAERQAALERRGTACRTAVYTTPDAGIEAAQLAREQDVDLVLADGTIELVEPEHGDDRLRALLEHAASDVAVLTGPGELASGPVVTPFGGVEHDWAAIEIAAWLAASLETTLRLVGTEADPARGRRDASRLLARASLLVQQLVGVATEPVLVPAGEHGVVDATRDGRMLVVGLSDRWRREGLGAVRRAVASNVSVPVLFVRRGLRPGGIAPSETLTRFTWTLAAQEEAP